MKQFDVLLLTDPEPAGKPIDMVTTNVEGIFVDDVQRAIDLAIEQVGGEYISHVEWVIVDGEWKDAEDLAA